MADISSQVDLSDPLGQPKIVTGTEYMDALARLGYNRENMFSPLPMITKNIQALTSLVDENYNNQMKWQASQAQSKEALARAGNIDSQTAYNNQALDLRLKDLDLQNKERQQNLDFATEAHPTVKRMLDNKGKQSDLDIQRAERSSKDEADSLDLLPQATAELPDPDDPDYVNKRDLWRIKYNRLLTNPTTKNRMEGEYQAVDSIYQGRISTQQTNAERKEFSDLQTGGFIPKVLNPDAAMRGPDKDSFLTRGRMLQARQQVEMVAAQLPDGDPYKDKLQTILNEADTHTKSDTGVQDIMAGKSSIFDTNGHLTGTSLAAAQQAQTHLTQLGVVPKPETEVKVPFGEPSQKGEYPGLITFKGLTPEAAETKARQYKIQAINEALQRKEISSEEATKRINQLNQPLSAVQPEAPGTPEQRFLQKIQDPQIRALGERLARKEINYQQFVDEMKKIPPPSQPEAKPTSSPTTQGSIPIEGTSTTSTTEPASEKLDIPARSFTAGRAGEPIQNVVLHSSDGTEHSSLQELTQGNVSAHYFVNRSGDVYHLVNDNDTAFHAGVVSNPAYSNAATLGIEQEHFDPGKEYPKGQDWPDAQVDATARLTARLLREHGLTPDNVKTHSEIASPAGRKQDPYGYPFEKFNKLVSNYYAQGPKVAPAISLGGLETHLGGRLAGHGGDFIEAGKQYNLNPALLASIAIEESGNGTNDATIARNNPMSMGGGSARYGSIRDGIFAAARDLRQNYVNQGLKDVASIGHKYAPPGAPNDIRGTNRLWPSDVTAIYNQITRPAGTASSETSFNQALPRPATVEEARRLPPGAHFIDPEGNRRMVA